MKSARELACQLVDAEEELGRAARGQHQVVLRDQQQLCTCRMSTRAGIFSQGIHRDNEVVLTHPAPDNLADAWRQLLPTIAAKHMDDSSALFTAAFQQSLTVLTEQMGEVRGR